MNGIREKIGYLVDHPISQRFIVILLFVNALTLGLETSDEIMSTYGSWIGRINDEIP
jgi:hypothetical protein